MKRKACFLMAGLFCLLACVTAAEADYIEDTGKIGVGFQSSWPSWGLSGIYDINRNISAQAVIGLFGTVHSYSVRGIYRFHREDYWNAYGYGSVGIWTYSHRFHGSESSLGLGAGAGIEFDWRMLNEDLPPLFSNVELGLGYAGLDHYSLSALWFGVGMHYRF